MGAVAFNLSVLPQGTTNSLCAVWLKGRPTLVPNEEGSHLTPSVVSFLSDGDYGDGAIAMDALRSDNRGAWVVVGDKVGCCLGAEKSIECYE